MQLAGENMNVKRAIEVLRAEGLRRHAILRKRASLLAKEDDAVGGNPKKTIHGDTYYERNRAETKKVYGKLSRLSHALRALSLFEGEI